MTDLIVYRFVRNLVLSTRTRIKPQMSIQFFEKLLVVSKPLIMSLILPVTDKFDQQF